MSASEISREEEVAEVFAIGIGECGSNLIGSYFEKAKKGDIVSRIREYAIMNTDKADLQKARKRYGISHSRSLEYGEGVGVGGRFQDGYNAIKDAEDQIINALQKLGYEGVNGFIIATALGGGTGCGGTPALIEILRSRFKEEGRRIFIYVVGVLPFANQSNEALNSVWALNKLLTNQLDGMGPDLILLLSNRTMLNRVISWQRGESIDLLNRQAGVDVADLSQEPDVTTLTAKEEDFIELINPLALKTIEQMLSPGIVEPNKDVYPTTDLGDFARKLDSIVVPAVFEDVPIFPEIGDVDKQLVTISEYAATNCTLTDLGVNPDASSVFSVVSGPKSVARVEYDPFLKRALRPFLAKGASITPSYVSYENERMHTSLLLLFGLPKIPEMQALIKEARDLVELHSGPSSLKQHWFLRTKGVPREDIVKALENVEQLFGIRTGPPSHPSSAE